MKLHYYGHAAFAVALNGKFLLFDPFISPNQATHGKVDIGELTPDYILLSHAHEDHVADVEAIAKKSGGMIVGMAEVAYYYMQRGFDKVHAMNYGGQKTFDDGLTVKQTLALHSSSFPDGSYGGNPSGYVVSSENDGTFYFAGDTALFSDMKLIAETSPRPLDFAVLPIGDNFTMGVNDAVRAADFLGVKKVVGCHYNTFPPIEIDTGAAQSAFSQAGKELLLPGIGETIEV